MPAKTGHRSENVQFVLVESWEGVGADFRRLGLMPFMLPSSAPEPQVP